MRVTAQPIPAPARPPRRRQHQALAARFVGIALAALPIGGAARAGEASDIAAALRAARPGDVVLMQGGDYGVLRLSSRDLPGLEAADGAEDVPPQPVVLRSADPATPIVLSGLTLKGVRNLTLDGIVFDYRAEPGSPDNVKPFQALGTKNVTIRNAIFDGDIARDGPAWRQGLGSGYALWAIDGENLAVIDSTFFNWVRGAIFSRISGLIVQGNELYAIRSDGFDFAQVSQARIEANYLHDFGGAGTGGDHPDMIQFWSKSTRAPSTDVTIRGNLLDNALGTPTHSIFIRNEVAETDPDRREAMLYRDFRIEDNLIRNGHIHAITVSSVRGLTVRGNTVLESRNEKVGGPASRPAINLRQLVEAAELTDNIAPQINVEESSAEDVRTAGNMLAQRDKPHEENHYTRLFVDALSDGRTEGWHIASTDRIGGLPVAALPALRGLQAKPGGALDRPDAPGAALTRSAALRGAWIEVEVGEGMDQRRLRLRAVSPGPGSAQRDLSQATMTWDFGDGTRIETTGPEATHIYEHPGAQRATVEIRGPGLGETTRAGVSVEAPVLLAMNSDFAAEAAAGLEPRFEATGLSPALQGGARIEPGAGLILRSEGGDQGTLSYGRPARFRDNRELTFSATIRMTDAAQKGTLLYYIGSLIVEVTSTGVQARLNPKGGKGKGFSLWASAYMLDGRWRRVTVTYSANEGRAAIFIDDALAVQRRGPEIGEMLAGSTAHDLYLGHPRKVSFGGLVRDAAILRAEVTPEILRAQLD